jgi:hypothetical protein
MLSFYQRLHLWLMLIVVLCLSAHTTTPSKWGHAAVSRKHYPPCDLYNIYACHQRRRLDKHLGFGGNYLYIFTVHCWGQHGTLWHACLYFSWRRHFAFNRNSEFSVWKELNSLNKLDEKFNFHSLYRTSGCFLLSSFMANNMGNYSESY